MVSSIVRRASHVLMAVLLVTGMLTAGFTQPALAAAKNKTKSFKDLPLQFEQNTGQADSTVRYVAHGHGYNAFITDTGIVLAFNKSNVAQKPHKKHGKQNFKKSLAGQTIIEIKLSTNAASAVAGLQPVTAKSTYMSDDGIRSAQRYAKVKLAQLYPGIDAVVYANSQQQLQYDFNVAPNADPKAIRLSVNGAKKVSVDKQGKLVIKTPIGDFAMQAPKSYQDTVFGRKDVTSSYKVTGNNVSFKLGAYDTSEPLVIDPNLVYATYLGGTAEDLIQRVAYDASGNMYAAGYTYSLDYPFASGFDNLPDADGDAFVIKLTPDGQTVVYATYLGGQEYDAITGMVVGGDGKVTVSGDTESSDYPLLNAAQTDAASPTNTQSFVSQLNDSGNSLVYSTFLGGSDQEVSHALSRDSSGNVYVAGYTHSTNFPATAGALSTNSAGQSDVYVAKLDTGGQIVYATYLGGTGADEAKAIQVDGLGAVYLTGSTTSTDFPTTLSAYDTSKSTTDKDVFVTKLNATGNSNVFSTYYGGVTSNGDDVAYGLSIDSLGAVVVTGSTISTDLPTTEDAFDRELNIGPGWENYDTVSDAFVARFSAAGTSLLYATMFGGESTDVATDVLIDANSGVLWLAGYSTSTSIAVTYDNFLEFNAGLTDGFLTAIDPGKDVLPYSTFVGSAGDEGILDIANLDGQILLGGWHSAVPFTTFSLTDPIDITSQSVEGLLVRFQAALNTVAGEDVIVQPLDGTTGSSQMTLTFDNVQSTGSTTLTTSDNGPSIPEGFSLGSVPKFYFVDTTATFTGPVEMCISWQEGDFADEPALALLHFDDTVNDWVDITTSLDTQLNRICGLTTSFSPFTVVQRDDNSILNFVQHVSNNSSLNIFKLEQTIPIRFELRRPDGTTIPDVNATLRVTKLTTDAAGNPIEIDQQVVGQHDVGNAFTYESGPEQYRFKLKTKDYTKGTYRLTVSLNGMVKTSVLMTLVKK